jgi:hypothetical protein
LESPEVSPRHGIGIQIPRTPLKEGDVGLDIYIRFSRKAVVIFTGVFIALTRLLESLGIELLRSIF